jgi:hypothetical protein
VYPTIPYKHSVLFGICVCLINGVMMPLFPFLLSQLMFEVSIGGGHVVTDRFMGSSSNTNYLVEDEKILRGGSFKGDWGRY